MKGSKIEDFRDSAIFKHLERRTYHGNLKEFNED